MSKNNTNKNKAVTRKWFIFLRIAIYTLSLLFLVFLSVFHFTKTNQKIFSDILLEKEDGYITLKKFYTKEYPHMQLSFKLDPEEYSKINPKELDISATRTLSPLLRKRSETITSEKNLRKELTNEDSSLLDGSFVKNNLTEFYVEEGRLKKIREYGPKRFFKSKTIVQEKLPSKMKYNFKNFISEETINNSNLEDDAFPKNLIIEAGDKFYLTGTSRISPIFSKKLIQKIKPSFSFISTIAFEKENMSEMICKKNTGNKTITCEASFTPLNEKKINIYYIAIKGLSAEKILKPTITLSK